MKKRTLIIIVLIVACVAVLIAWVIKRELGQRPGITVVSNGPLEMRLWGIRPDAGGVIYDLEGKKLCETFGVVRLDRFPWRSNYQRCDFIFELPDTNELSLLGTPLRIAVGDEDERWRGGRARALRMTDRDGRELLWLKTNFDRTFKRPGPFGLWVRDVPLDTVDVVLGYYQGPPGKSLCIFKGPFKPGEKFADETGLYEISLIQDPNADYPRCNCFELNAKRPFSRIERILLRSTRVLFYDTAGRRHTLSANEIFPGPDGTNIQYEIRTSSQSFREIKAITFGERPFEITLKNLPLDLLGRTGRTYPDYYDKMAERLNLSAEPKRLGGRAFSNVDDIISIADIVRGTHLLQIVKDITRVAKAEQGLEACGFDAEQIRKLKDAALGWTRAIDPEIREQTVIMGLQCEWPEFVEPACELLRDASSYSDSRDVVRCLTRSRKLLSDEAIDRIGQILPYQTDRNILMDLMQCLTSQNSAARIAALRQLAYDNRPWLWWPTIAKLASWGQFEDEHDELPQKMKLRLFLVRGGHGFSDAEQIATEAYSLLPELLTEEVRCLDSGTFYKVLDRIARHPDRKYATSAMIDFLRRVEDYHYAGQAVVDRIVKYINLWHGQNIGELGTDITEETGDLHTYDWVAITAEAIEWYDSRNNAVDANSAR